MVPPDGAPMRARPNDQSDRARCGYSPTRRNVASAASLARSNSCHAPPSGSAQRWPYQDGRIRKRGHRREIGDVARGQARSAPPRRRSCRRRSRPEQDQPALSARAVRHDRFAPKESGEDPRRCRELPRMLARPRNHGCVSGTAASGGTATTSAASASLMSHRSPTQLKPSRDDSTCAVVLLARRVASSCWNNRRSIRAGRAIASGSSWSW